MYATFIAPFAEFEFMRRALVGAVALALSAAPVGVFLMLRRMSLTGDAMAHAILPGVAVGYLVAGFSISAMTLGGLIAGLVVAVLAGLVARVTALKEDATLATFYLLSLALGVILVSVRGSNVDLLHVLFGNVLAIDDGALVLLAGIATFTLATLALIFRSLVLDTVDAGFLSSVSRSGGVAHIAFLGLVVVNLVGAFQALGTLLGVGIMVLPAVAARFWSSDINAMLPISLVFAIAGAMSGLLVSYHVDVTTGPAIILCLGVIALVSLLVGRAGGLVWKLVPRRHLEA